VLLYVFKNEAEVSAGRTGKEMVEWLSFNQTQFQALLSISGGGLLLKVRLPVRCFFL
jgi:hypothetical protein